MVDLIVIGAGPAGYHGAQIAANAGLSTVLVSDDGVGGVCLHSGCIPSKTLLHCTNLSRDHAAFAIYGGPHPVDLPVLRERISGIVHSLERGIAGQLAKAGVRVIEERAELLPKRDPYFTVKAGSEVVMSRYLLIATGSKERFLEIKGMETTHIVSISELLDHEQIPESLLIVGGGSMGLEIGSAFARMGSAVTIVEQRDQIAPIFDPDLSRILHKELEKENLTIHTGAEVVRFNHNVAEIIQGEHRFEIPVERTILALGRVPQSDISGISALEIERNDSGAIVVTPFGETSAPGCYASGDVTGDPMVAHAAYHDAERVIQHILKKTVSEQKPAVPLVLYTSPELASVGVTEQQAKDEGIPVLVRKRPLAGNGRFLAETSGERGVCKVILHKETGVILGVHLAMPHASELITAATLMVSQKLTAKDLANCIFPHPTMGEIIKQCIVEES